jgi:L-ornithine N5-oxygenase
MAIRKEREMRLDTKKTFELVCVGFGPAAIAVAAAIEDSVCGGMLPAAMRQDVVFLEKQLSTVWQGGLLLPGTNINHSPLRDLATPRDPGSPFTFSRYLKEKGRIYEHGAWSGAVGRIEWSDYVGWAAQRLGTYVHYGKEVERIGIVADGNVVVSSGQSHYGARQVMIACGMEPYLPEVFATLPSGVARHADSYLYYRDELDRRVRASGGQRFRVAIVGSGLTAAEIMHDLLHRHDHEQIHVISIQRGLSFRQYDMSPFSNQIYMPPEVARFSAAAPEARRRMFKKTWATNFSGVDAECATQEWNFLYERKLMDIHNATIVDRHEIVSTEVIDGGVRLHLSDVLASTETTVTQDADFLIVATGYRDTAPERLLNGMTDEIVREYDGLFSIAPDYRLKTSARVSTPIWLNGHCEHSHGIADTQSFSLVAFKAERLLHSIFGRHMATSAPTEPVSAIAGAGRQTAA